MATRVEYIETRSRRFCSSGDTYRQWEPRLAPFGELRHAAG